VPARDPPEACRRLGDHSSPTWFKRVWNPSKGRSETHILYNCGRAEDPEVTERLRRAAPEEIVAEHTGWQVVNAWPYGEVYALEALWAQLGIARAIEEVVAGRRFDLAVERALFAMVANRACAPASKLYCFSQWLAEDVRIAGTERLEAQHLYRAMDLPRSREGGDRAGHLLPYSRPVEPRCRSPVRRHYECATHEVDDEDRGVGPDDVVRGAEAAGAKHYAAPRKRGNEPRTGAVMPREGF
jgi:hypothetical protein